MSFEKKIWVDVPDGQTASEDAPAINAANLNRIEEGIEGAYTAIDETENELNTKIAQEIQKLKNNEISDLEDQVADIETNGATIESGSYVGTGEYGVNHPNTLTFNYIPKIVFIFPSQEHDFPASQCGILIGGCVSMSTDVNNSATPGIGSFELTTTLTNKTLSWYYSGSFSGEDSIQLNSEGKPYKYYAIC